MANDYLQFSQVIPQLTADEEQWLRHQLEVVSVYQGKEYAEDDLPKDIDPDDLEWTGCCVFRDLEDYDPDYDFDAGFSYSFHEDRDPGGWGRHLWVYGDEYGNVDRVVHLVQKFLKTFRRQESWSLEYACTCSKPRVGEFNGGAVFVTAEKIAWDNSSAFIEREDRIFKYVKQALSGTATETRPIEMYVGIKHGDAGAWYTTTVEIPSDTPAGAIPAVASAVLEKQLAECEEPVVFSGVYNIPDTQAHVIGP